MVGQHIIKSWASTQGIIALSSGEAEFYSIVKGGSVSIGVRSILCEMGVKARIRINTDASAAKGIASRRGIGKIRHIEVNQLWIQDRVARGEIELSKVPGKTNIADALTKYVECEGIQYHMANTNQTVMSGRHAIMPEMAEDEHALSCIVHTVSISNQ